MPPLRPWEMCYAPNRPKIRMWDGLLIMCTKHLKFFAFLAFFCGCHTTSKFEPEWLSDPSQVTYSAEYEGNIRVKLKAKVTEAGFIAVTKRLKMIPQSEDKEYAQNLETLRWRQGPDKRWNPLPSVEGTFVCHRLNWWETAKYENGILYYQVVDLEK
jgi:hypothetical protein